MHSKDILVREAATVRDNTYAPYPPGTCAEVGAIAAMVAGGDTDIKEVAVISDSPDPVTPCGDCRQKLAEFTAADVKITMVTTGSKELTLTMADILPGAFNTHHMSNT